MPRLRSSVLDRCVGLEAWWVTGELGAELGVPQWVDRAAERVTCLAAECGPWAEGLQVAAGRRLDGWYTTAGRLTPR